MNVATGRRTDSFKTFQILKKLTGYCGDVKYGPERAGYVKHSLADISRAEEFLGYKPKVDFEEGLSRTVAWYRSHYGVESAKLPSRRTRPRFQGFEETHRVVIFHVSAKIPESGCSWLRQQARWPWWATA